MSTGSDKGNSCTTDICWTIVRDKLDRERQTWINANNRDEKKENFLNTTVVGIGAVETELLSATKRGRRKYGCN